MPQRTEPLFTSAARASFRIEGLNSADAKTYALIAGSEDAGMSPEMFHDLVRRTEPYRGGLLMKPDWFFGRDVDPLHAGQVSDRTSRTMSSDPT